VDNTKTRRPQPRSNTKHHRVPSASKSSQRKNKEAEVEEHHRNLLLSKNNKHISSAGNNIKIDSQDVISKVVCAMCNKCLTSVNHDECLCSYVNDKNSRGKKQKAKVSFKENQMEYQPKVTKPKKVGFPERLATPKPRKSRFLLRWSPTARLFDQKGKLVASSESESQSDCSNNDNACTSNAMEPKIKRFPNSTSLLDRLFRFVYGASIRVVPMERQNRTLVEAARTMLIFSRASLFLWDEAIATACFTQNRSIIHRRFNKTPYELIDDKKPDISFLHVFGALCYPKNDREDIGKLGAKGDIGFFIGYHADSCAYRIYNRRTKKLMETMNVSFDELSGLDLTYAPSIITTQQPTKGELDLLFEAMYDDYIGCQPSATARTVMPAQEPQVLQTSTTYTTIADTAPTATNSSSHATNILITSQDVDELNSNAMVNGNMFVDPFANSSTSAAESSSSQNVDPSNMHTFYQPYPHEFQWTKDHPLEQVIGEPSRPVLTRNQL
nr:retrovirus-related Pol polyprotein from transposon TNT 1-94 [Tanacetum cinerariifolium]